MKAAIGIGIIALSVLLGSSVSEARGRHHRHYSSSWGWPPWHPHHRPYTHSGSNDGRPRAWCGWYLRHLLGVTDSTFNLAINWLHYGSPAQGPCVGCIAVGRHHVAKIVGGGPGHWITQEGNYNGGVHVGQRSLGWVIAYRK